MTKYVRPTAAVFNAAALTLRKSLADLSVSLHPGSELAAMIADLEWVGSLGEDDVVATALRMDGPRAAHSFLRLHQVRRLSLALQWAATQPGIHSKAHRLGKTPDRLKSTRGSALDLIFELEVAYLASRRFPGVRLEEPDLVLKGVADYPVGLACKRPQNLDAVPNAYRRARHQVGRCALQGVVVIGMENIIFDAEAEGKPWKSALYTAGSARDLRKIAAPHFARAIEVLRIPIDQTPEANLVGVLLCACVTAMTKRPSGYSFAWTWTSWDREGRLAKNLAERIFGKANRVSWALLGEQQR